MMAAAIAKASFACFKKVDGVCADPIGHVKGFILRILRPSGEIKASHEESGEHRGDDPDDQGDGKDF